jgi:outer membrane protein assembly factor BamD (BamD/ComL family)
MFALAQIYDQDSTRPSAATVDSLYKQIIDQFPESEFATESRRHLGLAPPKKTEAEDTRVYASAERLMAEGKTTAAIDTFALVVREYPESPLASKAMYSVGWLYEQVALLPDSAIASYQKLVDLYPKSEYAEMVKPKLSEVDLFRKAKEHGGTDSTKSGVMPEQGEKKLGQLDREDVQKSDSTKVKRINERGALPPERPPEEKKPANPKP